MEYDAFTADRLGEKSPDRRLFFFLFLATRRLPMKNGLIHSIESMGLVDGPGIRTVVFLQGCALRCRYCHNPDTWCKNEKAFEMSVPELLAKLERFRPYYGTTGGVTFSGGEPLLQPEFLLGALTACKQAGIHTCLDTAGCGLGDYRPILQQTDLILLDVKHPTRQGFEAVTGHSPDESLRFLAQAQQMGIPLWVRHVVVPGLTDGEEHFKELERYLQTLKHIQRVELLPYHTLGVHKYAALGLPYTLEGVPPLDPESLTEWNKRLNQTCCAESAAR